MLDGTEKVLNLTTVIYTPEPWSHGEKMVAPATHDEVAKVFQDWSPPIRDLIAKLLGDRGVVAPPELSEFLVPRIERSYLAVQQVVDLLDRAMLSHHRRMTVPLAKRALVEAGLLKRAKNRVQDG